MLFCLPMIPHPILPFFPFDFQSIWSLCPSNECVSAPPQVLSLCHVLRPVKTYALTSITPTRIGKNESANSHICIHFTYAGIGGSESANNCEHTRYNNTTKYALHSASYVTHATTKYLRTTIVSKPIQVHLYQLASVVPKTQITMSIHIYIPDTTTPSYMHCSRHLNSYMQQPNICVLRQPANPYNCICINSHRWFRKCK